VSAVHIVLMARDGTAVPLSGSANCRFEDGRPVSTRTILRDVSGERAREAELARVEANLRAVFESTGDPIWSVDREGRLVTFNTAFALLLEVITEKAPEAGAPMAEIMSAEAAEWFRGCYARALQGSRFSATREENVDGEPRIFDMFFNPIESSEGGIGGVVVFARDATRRHRVEAALRRAKRDAEEASDTKSHFLASMSHELRTPLNSIIGFSNILLRKAEALPEKERGFLERILANGKHLLSLINEILDLSKIEAGHMELQLERVELPALVEETVGQLEAQVAGRPVELRWEVEGTPEAVRTDGARLKQVIINLVGNALKFTESGEVRVRVETASDGRTPARIRVRDTGIGIPEDRIEAIFQAFEQADGGTARRFGGTGLGLAISRSLCTLMGYELRVESEVGKGSDFIIEMAQADLSLDDAMAPPAGARAPTASPPDASPASRTPPAPEVSPENLAGRTVLVVDDEADSRALLRHTLEELGCRVVTARDGVEGLEVARAERPDLITLDLMMPRMTGWEMLRALRDDPQVRHVPVVVVSILAEDGGGQVLGAVDLLTKPVERAGLEAALARHLPRVGVRILVVDDDPAVRGRVTGFLEEAGYAVHATADGAAALRYLERVPVALVLTDLTLPNMDGLTLLRRIRASPRFAALPVVVLASREVTPAEEALLATHGADVVPRGGEIEAMLARALGGILGETPDPSPGNPGA
jgi:PAS domain S-box-containing protein